MQSPSSRLLAGEQMPPGYSFGIADDDDARFVLGKSTWAVLALTCHIELLTQAHYRASTTNATAPSRPRCTAWCWTGCTSAVSMACLTSSCALRRGAS
ncbi:MAG: hypothetical protein H7Z19_14995 [Chitinophagaceae bacterium]|nr:hypothetical protein [Rubrivivax sp.]